MHFPSDRHPGRRFPIRHGSLLDLFGNIKYETAVERAGTSGFEGSMRQIEWSKAWIAFQSAPWFGHGWNSFAQQTFLINAQQQYFPNNILGVLFTHSHNIVMQLLSEMGITGTLLATLTLLQPYGDYWTVTKHRLPCFY